MTNFIPIFPLDIVVFPGESLHLHIFEPKYKELINDCYATQKPFGIVVVLDNAITELGTLLSITEITKVYDDGKMDIKTKGVQIFNILELIKTVPDKLYSGAIVTYPTNETLPNTSAIEKIVQQIKQLHSLLEIEKKFKKPVHELLSYDIAHHIGLTIKEEFELMKLLKEIQRLEFIKRHLKKVIEVLDGMENLKQRIQLNGHFKELKGFNL